MTQNYKIVVTINDSQTGRRRIAQSLFITATQPDLVLVLQTFNSSPSVIEIKVFNTVSVPELSVLNRLTRTDIGIDDGILTKVV